MNLQELADLPYAGMAEKELKKAGHWNEYAGLEEKQWNVTVEVARLVYSKEDIVVYAHTEEQAAELAEKEFDDCEEAEATIIKEAQE